MIAETSVYRNDIYVTYSGGMCFYLGSGTHTNRSGVYTDKTLGLNLADAGYLG